MNTQLRVKIARRSRGRCEAWVCTPMHTSRCPNIATDIHHLLTKGRGGALLDSVGETYHLIHLCRDCHMASDDGKQTYNDGMLIDGYVTWDKITPGPVYHGTDEYLKEKYGHVPTEALGAEPVGDPSA